VKNARCEDSAVAVDNVDSFTVAFEKALRCGDVGNLIRSSATPGS
jgi:hypothetical protein